MRWIQTLLVTVFVGAVAVSADTYVVDDSGTGDFATIQAAIDACVDGDVVLLMDGTFSGDGNRDIDFGGKAIWLRSQSLDPAVCVIDCEGSSAFPRRGFDFHSGESQEAKLYGITIINGYAAGATEAGKGGGIRCIDGSSLTLHYCQIVDCVAEQRGGGISCDLGCNLEIVCCTFSGNECTNATTSGGGGIGLSDACTATLIGCDFLDNLAYYAGGGLGVWNGSSATLTECKFSSNHANDNGGGISCAYSSTLNMELCLVDGNFSNKGGGLLIAYSSEATMVRSTVSNNNGAWGGAMNVAYGSTATATNATFYSNGGASGNIIVLDSGVAMDLCIVAFGRDGSAFTYGTPTLTCCDVYGNVSLGTAASQMGQNGNIEEDPCFCDAPEGNYGLLSDSPCTPYSEPNPECALIGAWDEGCGSSTSSAPWHESDTTQLRLTRIAPNPLARSAVITYEIDANSDGQDFTLDILDVSGRLVRALVHDRRSSGTHHVTWDGHDDSGRMVNEGVYFCRLRTPFETYARTLTVLR